MNFSLELFLIAFTSFITIINPLNVMPVFMSMTSGLSAEDKKVVATKALLTAFVTMLIFAFAGQIIFKFFSITVDSFRVVGGILLVSKIVKTMHFKCISLLASKNVHLH